MTPNRLETVKLRAVALAMVLAPALLVFQEWLTPVNHESDSTAEQLAAAAGESTQYGIALIAFLAGMVLMIPATIALMGRVRERGAWWAFIGGCAVVLALVMFCVNIGAMGLTMSAFAELPAAQRAAIEPGADAIIDARGVLWMPIVGLVLGLFIGPVVLAVGLWRSGTVPRWAVAAFPLGWWLLLLGPSHEVRALGPALLLVVLGVVAWQSLRRDVAAAEERQPGHLGVERAAS